ncbi:MAG TPA: efflux RND transporter periplasmic adaptor subunit [Vicinamibacterales bacterium]|nr:efflux RND transporter periplasmic adaptor subunit [Vicinamibacterales bacterium]
MTKRLTRIGLAVLVLALVLVWAFRPAAVPADFATVERGPLRVTVEEEGRTRVHDRYVVSAPLPGHMQRIQLEPGDPVVAGKTLLAQFQSADPALIDVRTRAELEARVKAAESAIGAARAEVERIKADLEFARSELTRAQELVEQRVIAPRELESAERQVQSLERALQSAEFNVRTAQHQLEVARAGLLQSRGGRVATIPLYAPIDGVVLRRLQESETVVPTGTPLVEVGNLDDLEVVADLLSSAAVRVEPGQKVLIDQWGGGHTLDGRVRRIEPSGFTKISALGVEEQRVNVLIDFAEPREKRRSLGDGYRVEVRIIVWEKDDVLKVPASSLFRYEGKWAVYKVEDLVAVRQLVEIGQRNGLEAEVLSGLSAGDRIVVYPSDAIQDGVRLTPRS